MNQKVSVIAPARLHMGFIDLSGSLGRDFGSIGVALEGISTKLSICYADKLQVTGPGSSRAKQCTQQLCKILALSDQLRLTIETAIPEHVGLGSGTQMVLAIGTALNAFYGLGLSVRKLAELANRGMRSGIGIGVFEQGGLVVDGGRDVLSKTPPLIARLAVPDDWQFILVFDGSNQGLHGKPELDAFKALPAFPATQAARLCHLLLMQGLPAIAEHNIRLFGAAITQIQRSVGEHFAPAQGGIFASNTVAQVMQWLEQQGCVAIGQTSWGPTGFCVVDNSQQAEQLLTQMRQHFAHFEQLNFVASSANNKGKTLVIDG